MKRTYPNVFPSPVLVPYGPTTQRDHRDHQRYLFADIRVFSGSMSIPYDIEKDADGSRVLSLCTEGFYTVVNHYRDTLIFVYPK